MLEVRPNLIPTEQILHREDIVGLHSRMKAAIAAGTAVDAVPFTQLKHSFVAGLYARQLWRPAGTLIVGKIHRYDCFTFLMSGHLTVWTENETADVVAPNFFESPAGGRKVTFAHQDSLLITVHATTETDVAKLESELVTEDYADLLPESYKQFAGIKS